MRLILLSFLVIAGLAIALPASAQVDSTEVLQEEASGAAETSSKWRFAIRPYLYLSGVSGSVTLDPLTFPINSSFTDILDNLSFGGFLSLSAEKGQATLLHAHRNSVVVRIAELRNNLEQLDGKLAYSAYTFGLAAGEPLP